MAGVDTILPGTGRGTIRRMVEGARRPRRRWGTRAPSVSPEFILSDAAGGVEGGCHLPVPGRI